MMYQLLIAALISSPAAGQGFSDDLESSLPSSYSVSSHSYGSGRESTLPRDMLAAGAATGILIPALVAIPMWESFLKNSSVKEYDEYSIQKVTSSLTVGSLLAVVLAPSAGVGAYMAAGGDWSHGRVLRSSFIGAAIAYPCGGGLAALAIQPILKKEYNHVEVLDRQAPYRAGSLIWFTTISTGAVLGGLVGAKARPDYKLTLAVVPGQSTPVLAPTISMKW